jgi:hypothetical protein
MPTAQQGFPPIDLVMSGEVKTYAISLLANVETSVTLTNGLNQLFIKCRTMNACKISFISGDITLGNYWTIPVGCTESITSLDFLGKTLYLEASVSCTIEVMELYT